MHSVIEIVPYFIYNKYILCVCMYNKYTYIFINLNKFKTGINEI